MTQSVLVEVAVVEWWVWVLVHVVLLVGWLVSCPSCRVEPSGVVGALFACC